MPHGRGAGLGNRTGSAGEAEGEQNHRPAAPRRILSIEGKPHGLSIRY